MLLTPNGFWKLRARAALKGHWQTALFIALIAGLPSLLVQGITNVMGLSLSGQLSSALYTSVNNMGQLDLGALSAAIDRLWANSGVWLMQGISLLVTFLSPFLSLGFYNWSLGRLRNLEDAGISSVFSRASLFFKAIGLKLWITLWIFIRILPGIALCILGFVPLWISPPTTVQALETSLMTTTALFYGGLLVCVVLGVMAYLKYALSEILLSDHPELSVREAALRSKALMTGHRKELFFLVTSFLLWYLLANYLSLAADSLGGSVPGLMVSLLGSIALQVYVRTTICAFAMGLQGENPKSPVSEQSTGLER